MLAEVLHRVKILCAAAVFALTSSGCEWDGASEFDEVTAEDVVVSSDEDLTAAESIVLEQSPEEKAAKALLADWLELLADGDTEAAEEMTAGKLKATGSELRLFNETFPREADIAYYAPAAVSEKKSITTVTLRVTVTPADDHDNRVNAEVTVKIAADGSGKIVYLREIGSNAMDERALYHKAFMAYEAASEVFDSIKPVPFEGMHHMGDGSELTEAVREKMCPSSSESFSIAVRDKKLMYVSWSDGIYSQRYPKPKQ